MKNMKRIIALTLICLLAFTLVACGNGGGNKLSPVGTYSLTSMTQDGEATSQEDLDLFNSLGLKISLEILENKTGKLTLLGEELDITWDDKYIIIDGEKTPYTFDGTILSIEQDGTGLTFTKDAEGE